MHIDDIQNVLDRRPGEASDIFQVMKHIALFARDRETEDQARQLAIRAIDSWNDNELAMRLISNILRQVGLYPYLNADHMSIRERVEIESNKPIDLLYLEPKLIFHRGQSEAYQILMDGHSLVLSAPTSFGKSLLIDALIDSQKFSVVMIIVPTIALMDETRRRLSRFSKEFKIITHGSQSLEKKTILILTQERAVDRDDIDHIDLLIVDEFYKLDINSKTDGDRAAILNQAFYKYNKISKQFYMLGPSIRGIPEGFGNHFRCTFLATQFNTVVTEYRIIEQAPDRMTAFLKLAGEVQGQTLVYSRSPKQADDLMKALAHGLRNLDNPILEATAEWIRREYHPDWTVAEALRKGIGIHHGRIPRAIAHLFVRLFNEGHLTFLVCTSSLIEGVNTVAKNVILYENKIARSRIDFFTYNNISGRSGRMFKHFVGRVYLFDEPPQPELDIVDIPLFTQSDDTPLGLLIQMDDEDLTPNSRGRLSSLSRQDFLPLDVIRANSHLDPHKQIEVAELIWSDCESLQPYLNWSGRPTYDQLRKVCEIIFSNFCTRGQSGIFSGNQLAYRLNQLLFVDSTREFIEDIFRNDRYVNTPDDAVEVALQFQRNWAMFNFPRFLMALEKIQAHVFSVLDMKFGDYGHYAGEVECLFLSPEIIALEEYGIPVEVGRKIMRHLVIDNGLDSTLNSLREFKQVSELSSDFERDLIRDTIDSL